MEMEILGFITITLITLVFIVTLSIIVKQSNKINSSDLSTDFYPEVKLSNLTCNEPNKLIDGEIVFCDESCMYYSKTKNGFIPMISEENQIKLFTKYGKERMLSIVTDHVSMKLYQGNIQEIVCYQVSLESISDKIIKSKNNGK